MDAVKRPTLKEFLVLPCGDVLGNPPVSVHLENLIREWAISMQSDHGQLPGTSGAAFAQWLDEGWGEWTEEGEVTVQKILEGAVSEWCGGRSF